MSVIALTSANEWTACLAANGTASSFSSTVPVETAVKSPLQNPAIASAGFVTVAKAGNMAESFLVVQPTADANNATASLRVWGWSQCPHASDGFVWLKPVLLVQVAYTAGNILSAISGQYIADTITRTAGDSTLRLYSPTTDSLNDIPGQFAVDLLGSRYVYFDFAINSGSAASMNGFYRLGS